MKMGSLNLANTIHERAFVNLSGEMPIQARPTLFERLAQTPPPAPPPPHLGQHVDLSA